MGDVDLQDGMTANLTAEKIQAHLELLTSDESRRSSKRLIAFLRYVVEETLKGSADQIKERTIGIEVFGRSSSYDTNLDDTVTTAATELRKRLAIYYGGEKHSSELRIGLVPSSYIPRFTHAHQASQTASEAGAHNGISHLSEHLQSAAGENLASALVATGKPLIIVLMNGSALALQGAGQKASTILEAWYPGEFGGTAIAETLFGENNPSARLPLTFYASTSQLPPFHNYAMEGRTYRYFSGTPLYAFGYGLSYTSFRYGSGRLSSKTLQAGKALEASVQIENVGDRDGDETVEFYLVPKDKPGAPICSLAGFEKVHLLKGETKTINRTVDSRQLSLVDADGSRNIEPGDYELYVGGSQPSSQSGISLPFHIEGQKSITP